MPVTFVGSDSGQTGSNTTGITLSLPTHQADDFGIILAYADEQGTVPVLSVSGASGWTQLRTDNPTTGRDRVATIFYKRFTSGSETNPTVDISIAQEKSASVHVFRGVDTLDPFDVGETFSSGQNDTTPINPAITTVTDSAALVLFHCATHDDISVAGLPTTPSGLVLGETILGSTNDHRGQITAYLLDAGTAGTTTPTAWTHTSSPTGTAEWTVYTLALREVQPIGVSDVNTDEQIDVSEQNNTITGFGFEATQGTGLVELADGPDYATATRVTQTIDTWSDTSIQFDHVLGSLGQGTQYLFVTNDSGDRSAAFQVNVGIAPYTDFILALDPDHFWKLNNVYDDTGTTGPVRNMTSGVVGTHTFGAPICEDNTHAWQLRSVTDRREITDSPNMNITISSQERTLACWVVLNGIQQSLGAIWKEGGAIQNLAFLVGIGNVLVWQLADTAGTRDNVQAISDIRLTPGRPYFLTGRYSHTDNPAESLLYLDGVEQEVTDGNPMTLGIFDTHSGDVTWGDPDNNLETGGTDIAYAGQEDCDIAMFATWSDNSANSDGGGIPPATIRELFERGALADLTIATDTEANMQVALDAIADTVRPDWPLCIRINPVSGGGDLKLIADNVTFDPRASIHIQWMGGGGETLTWVNANGSNASITSQFAGGTVDIVEAVPVSVSVEEVGVGTALSGARVYIEADTGGPLAAGTVILNDVTDGLGDLVGSLEYSADQPVTGWVRLATGSPRYKEGVIQGTITSAGFSATVPLVRDE